MGGDNSKLDYRNVIVQLTTRTQPIDANDNEFWEQFWAQNSMSIDDIFALIPAAEIRALRAEAPNNLATLCYKTVERLSQISESVNLNTRDQQIALNCVRLLTRLLPYIFEDPEWRLFFWSVLPTDSNDESECVPLAQSLLSALCDLLFSPDFTVQSLAKSGPDCAGDMHTVDSCEYIWQAGVGFAQTSTINAAHDSNRTEILKLILTCFSETMYLEQDEAHHTSNKWVNYFTSTANRHALPLFASLLNVVCAYDPIGYGVPYNHLMFADTREPLAEISLQLLCILLERDPFISSPFSGRSVHRTNSSDTDERDDSLNNMSNSRRSTPIQSLGNEVNLFVNYMSRIHRDEDFSFILHGLTRLLNNPLAQTYLPGSSKKIQMHEELLILFWRMCECNKQFLYFVLKSSQVLDLLVPILFHLNNGKIDQSRMGVIHVCVFILLLLSGERNFGVRLNKPYRHRVVLDIPVFTGTHADLLVIVSHKLITSGHNRLNPLFDCLLTIISNVSPYLKSLSMVSANKLLHLLDVFSQPWFLYCNPSNHQLIFLLLEIFNNIIQYQFDGNSNLVYTLIRKRQLFYRLANLSTDEATIHSVLRKQTKWKSNQLSFGRDNNNNSSAPTSPAPANLNTVTTTTTSTDGVVASTDKLTSAAATIKGGSDDFTSNLHNLQISDDDNNDKLQYDTGPYTDTVHCSTTNLPPLHKLTDKHPGQATHLDHIKHNTNNNDNGKQFIAMDRQSDLTPDTTDQDLVSHSDFTSTIQQHPQQQQQHQQQQSQLQQRQYDQCTNEFVYVDKSGSNVTGIGEHSLKSRNDLYNDNTTMETNKAIQSKTSSSARTDRKSVSSENNLLTGNIDDWQPTSEWVIGWKSKMPFQTIMRLLQVLVPQVEKICIDKGLTDESEIVRFLQNGTLVGLLPVPHPILIRKYQSNIGTTIWFRNYLWGVIYLRNINPPIWYDTNIRLFEIQRVT